MERLLPAEQHVNLGGWKTRANFEMLPLNFDDDARLKLSRIPPPNLIEEWNVCCQQSSV